MSWRTECPSNSLLPSFCFLPYLIPYMCRGCGRFTNSTSSSLSIRKNLRKNQHLPLSTQRLFLPLSKQRLRAAQTHLVWICQQEWQTGKMVALRIATTTTPSTPSWSALIKKIKMICATNCSYSTRKLFLLSNRSLLLQLHSSKNSAKTPDALAQSVDRQRQAILRYHRLGRVKLSLL